MNNGPYSDKVSKVFCINIILPTNDS